MKAGSKRPPLGNVVPKGGLVQHQTSYSEVVNERGKGQRERGNVFNDVPISILHFPLSILQPEVKDE